MSVNEQLLHDAIRHAVQLEGYKNHAVVEVLQALNQAQAKLLEELAKGGTKAITKAHLEAMIVTLKRVNDAAWAEVNKNLLNELVSLSEYEAVWQAESLKRRTKGVLPKDLSVNTPAPAQVWAAVKARPFAGGTLLEGVVEKLGKKSTERIEGAIRQGFVEGETLSQIEMKIRGTRSRGYKDGLLEMDRRHARTITRTAVAHTATVARLKTYEDNADLVKGIRFVATLDGRTSPICQALDGTVWEDTEKALLPPRHFGCRSTTVPVLKSWRELGFDLDEVPETTRASMNGQVPANLDYDAWLRKQAPIFQDGVLGKHRAELFRSGVSVKRFVDNGQILTLNELYAQDGISKPVTGIAPKPVAFRAVPESIEEANLWAVKNGIADRASFDGACVDVANEWNKGVADTLRDFPLLRPNFKFIGTTQEQQRVYLDLALEVWMKKPEMIKLYPDIEVRRKALTAKLRNIAGRTSGRVLARSYQNPYTQGICINSKYAQSKSKILEVLKRSVSSGFHPVGTDTVKALVDHEVGHQLDAFLQLSTDPAMRKLYIDNRKIITSELSGYATKNIGEMIAEGWAEYRNNPSPRYLASEIGKLIMRKYHGR